MQKKLERLQETLLAPKYFAKLNKTWAPGFDILRKIAIFSKKQVPGVKRKTFWDVQLLKQKSYHLYTFNRNIISNGKRSLKNQIIVHLKRGPKRASWKK